MEVPWLVSCYFSQPVLVQDFVDGDTLDKEIHASRKWQEVEIKDFLLEVLEILAYVHSRGSIHRDLKPNNMMRRKVSKKLVLIDFGAVREVRQTTTNLAIGLASGTITIGTPGYMPAEQTQGKPCFASDVYAIGCIAIEALIGSSPFPDGFETDIYGEFRWRHQARVSDALAAIIDKMVRYDWRQRYVNAGEALAALKKLSSNQGRNVNPVLVKSATGMTTPVNPPRAKVNKVSATSANKTPYVSPKNSPAVSSSLKLVIGLAMAIVLGISAWTWRERQPSKTFSGISDPTASPTTKPNITSEPIAPTIPPPIPTSSASASPSASTATAPNKGKADFLSLNKLAGEYKVVLDLRVLADAEKEGVKSVTGRWIIKADGTFVAILKAVSTKDEVQEMKTTGKITIEDGKVVSQVETVNGEKPQQTPPKQPYTLSADGNELQADGQPVKLVKQ